MPNFNSPDAAEKFKLDVYARQQADRAAQQQLAEAEARYQRAERRADKAFRQNRILIIVTAVIGFLTLLVELLANLPAIASSLQALLLR